MRRGPKGAAIETQLEVTATRTWKFTREELVKRLGLPEDASVFMRVPGGGDWSNTDLTVGDGADCLMARATETRSPKAKVTP